MQATASLQADGIPLDIAIRRYFEVALFLLILTGFGTLASTGTLDVPTVLLVGSALLLRGYLLAKKRTWMIPERWTTYLTLIYIAFYLADYFVLSSGFLSSTVHLVLFVMVMRLFSARRDRDQYFLAVLAFLMVLAASVLTVDSVFLLAFAAFMLMAVVTFVLMEMRHATAHAKVQAKDSNDPQAYRHMGLSLAGTGPVLVLIILMGAAAIFFVLPRISAGYLSAYAAGGEVSTGFADSVQLGRIGQIQQSNSVVMHIQIDGDQTGGLDLKWRGVSLSVFNGKSWSNPHEKFVLPRMPDGSYALRASSSIGQAWRRSESVRPIHYRVMMEPIGSSVFFLANAPRLLEGNYRMVAADGGGAVFDLDPEHPVGLYEASSIILQPRKSDLRAASGGYPPDVLLDYLQLPTLDPRIPQLAEQITAAATNNYDKATALENYLRTHFGYTLQLSRVAPRDPLANFLFERKQGHCEYFASAMAIMLRTLRIPARVVNGFRTGEYNDVSAQYVVRASNAHSWVEAYFPEYGWVEFDPTPGGGALVHNGTSRVMLYLDAIASFWREWIINYDVQHQTTLGRSATRTARQFFDQLRNWGRTRYSKMLQLARRAHSTVSESPGHWSVGIFFAAFALVLGANIGRFWRVLQNRRIASHPGSAPRQAASLWYQRMARAVARRGWRKLPGQTPGEFLGRIQHPALRSRVAQFTRCYEEARFGGSAESASRLPDLFQDIEEVVATRE